MNFAQQLSPTCPLVVIGIQSCTKEFRSHLSNWTFGD